jgi:outer membrane protein assembly factor BamB
MKAVDVVVVASKYRVAAFRKADGVQLWETVLIEGFFKIAGPFVTLAMDDSGIYAHVSNKLFRLDLMTGKILWMKETPTLGWDIASLALAGSMVSSTTSAFAKIDMERKRESSGGGE